MLWKGLIMEKYICDECKFVFTKSEVITELFPKNFNLYMQPIIVMDKNGKAKRTMTKDIKEGDRSLHCPKCKKSHLFGFNMINESNR